MEKKQLSERAKFWIKFALWALFGLVAPVMFIGYRYSLFGKATTIQLGGWGMIALVIAAFFFSALFKYLWQGFKAKWSLLGQIVVGIAKVIIPLLALFFVLNAIKDSIEMFMQALGVTIFCEMVAIIFNPMPKWVYDRTKKVNYDIVDYYFQKIKEEE